MKARGRFYCLLDSRPVRTEMVFCRITNDRPSSARLLQELPGGTLLEWQDGDSFVQQVSLLSRVNDP